MNAGINHQTTEVWRRSITKEVRWQVSKFCRIKRGIIFSYFPESTSNNELEEKIFIRRACPDDLDKLKEIQPHTADFTQWLNDNSLFLVAFDGDRIAGYGCVQTYPRKPLDRVIRLQPDEAWGHNAFVLPVYRNKGVYSSLFSKIAQIARERGIRKIYGDVLRENHLSLKIHKKFGCKELGGYTYLNIFGIEKLWLKGIDNEKSLQ